MCDCLPGTILVNDLHNLYLSHVFEHFTILSEKNVVGIEIKFVEKFSQTW